MTTLPSHDTAFQLANSNIRFGNQTTAEVGDDLREMQAKRVLVVIDPALLNLSPGVVVAQSLKRAGIGFDLFAEVAVEPTDGSFRAAADIATTGKYDAFVAVGGGSTIDTAKAANLFSTWPAEFFDYVNAPVGKGLPVPGPLKPLIAIPTTAGTGSETTGTAIFDWREKRLKTGIAHRYLRPTLGIIDPENTRTQPPQVAASCGLDVLSHALESFTAKPYDSRPRPERPSLRPPYQGANPISDLWALQALEIVAQFLVRAVRDPNDDEARTQMLYASTYAGIGFGNAGVHLPHAMAYPVAGMVYSFHPEGYPADHAMIPHGMSVILHTAAVARFTAPASPRRHLQAAVALGANADDCHPDAAGEILAQRVIDLMRDLQMPSGIAEVGYSAEDIPALVEGTLAQQRLTKLSPRPASATDLAELFRRSLNNW